MGARRIIIARRDTTTITGTVRRPSIIRHRVDTTATAVIAIVIIALASAVIAATATGKKKAVLS